MYQLRQYQRRAVESAVSFLTSDTRENGIIVLPTGSGKSLVIAATAYRLDAPVLIFQPSKEILEQNVGKLRSYGATEIGVFSATLGMKTISKFTFAMIGSVKRYPAFFRQFRYIIIDECHLVNPETGMYREFLAALAGSKVLGLTATPYRLFSSQFTGLMLRFITRMKPAIFTRLVYYAQVAELSNAGYLAPVDYYDIPTIDIRALKVNSTLKDYEEKSLQDHYRNIHFAEQVATQIEGLLLAGVRSLLVFTRFTGEANFIATYFRGKAAVVTALTPKKERDVILTRFKAGELRIVLNVGVLTTGFDFPALEAVLLARPTMSLALYYQMVGRVIRPDGRKRKKVIDMCSNIIKFGRVEDLRIQTDENGRRPAVFSRGKQLTNIYYR